MTFWRVKHNSLFMQIYVSILMPHTFELHKTKTWMDAMHIDDKESSDITSRAKIQCQSLNA